MSSADTPLAPPLDPRTYPYRDDIAADFLEGKVETIAPDTLRDEVKPEIVYYRVLVRTDSDVLTTQSSKQLPITPGMVTTTDIRTGRKTVWDYITKPLNKTREALRER